MTLRRNLLMSIGVLDHSGTYSCHKIIRRCYLPFYYLFYSLFSKFENYWKILPQRILICLPLGLEEKGWCILYQFKLNRIFLMVAVVVTLGDSLHFFLNFNKVLKLAKSRKLFSNFNNKKGDR